MNSSTARVDVDPVTFAVVQILENRAVIEQAKGVLMAVYNIDADAALDILKERSQQTNIKLRVLAEQLMTDFRLLYLRQLGPPVSTFDERDNDV